MYSQAQLIQTLETPQKVSAGIKRVMLLKSKNPIYYKKKYQRNKREHKHRQIKLL